MSLFIWDDARILANGKRTAAHAIKVGDAVATRTGGVVRVTRIEPVTLHNRYCVVDGMPLLGRARFMASGGDEEAYMRAVPTFHTDAMRFVVVHVADTNVDVQLYHPSADERPCLAITAGTCAHRPGTSR